MMELQFFLVWVLLCFDVSTVPLEYIKGVTSMKRIKMFSCSCREVIGSTDLTDKLLAANVIAFVIHATPEKGNYKKCLKKNPSTPHVPFFFMTKLQTQLLWGLQYLIQRLSLWAPVRQSQGTTRQQYWDLACVYLASTQTPSNQHTWSDEQ